MEEVECRAERTSFIGVRIPSTLMARMDQRVTSERSMLTRSMFVRRALTMALENPTFLESREAAHDLREKLRAEVAALSKWRRKKTMFLDMLLDGETLGNLCDALNLDRVLVRDIINDDIDCALAAMSRLIEALRERDVGSEEAIAPGGRNGT